MNFFHLLFFILYCIFSILNFITEYMQFTLWWFLFKNKWCGFFLKSTSSNVQFLNKNNKLFKLFNQPFFGRTLFFLFSKLLGKYWLIKLYGFRVYNSMIHDIYIALCIHHAKSNRLWSTHIWSLHPLLLPHHLPSYNHHTIVCAYEFFLLLICFFLFYIPHIRYSIWLMTSSVSFHLA